MPITIHNKSYKTVAERLNEAHATSDLFGVETEVLYLDPQIMVKATIKTKKGVFTGISAADPNKSIEAKTPVEVAETSAVGRALAFAGYAGSEIASVDEMVKAGAYTQSYPQQKPQEKQDKKEDVGDYWCDIHKCSMKLNKNGKPYHRNQAGEFCNGYGFPSDPRPKDSRKAEPENDSYGIEGINSAKDINDDIPF